MNVNAIVPGENFEDREEFKEPVGKRSCRRSSLQGREFTKGLQGPSFTLHFCPTSKMRFAHTNIKERNLTMNKHKRKSILRTALFGALLVLALHLVAGPAAMAMVVDGESITGIVAETDAGYVIIAEFEDYLVVGLDLSDMIGLTVKATGTVSEGDDGKEIHATSVEQM